MQLDRDKLGGLGAPASGSTVQRGLPRPVTPQVQPIGGLPAASVLKPMVCAKGAPAASKVALSTIPRFMAVSLTSWWHRRPRQSVFQNQARIRRSREEHARIIEAIVAGDAIAAGQLMIEHISIGGRDFRDFVSTVPRQLLASEVEAYPGKATAERQRTAAAAAFMPSMPAPASRRTRNIAGISRAKKVARSEPR